jgi:hypothetical protein
MLNTTCIWLPCNALTVPYRQTTIPSQCQQCLTHSPAAACGDYAETAPQAADTLVDGATTQAKHNHVTQLMCSAPPPPAHHAATPASFFTDIPMSSGTTAIKQLGFEPL